MHRYDEYEFRDVGRKKVEDNVMYCLYVHVFNQLDILQQMDDEGRLILLFSRSL